MKLQLNAKTTNLSTMQVGGIANTYLEITDKTQWGQVAQILKSRKVYILGNGSNTVFGDYFDGVVVKLGGEFKSIKATGTGYICGGGVQISRLCEVAKADGKSGLEGICGIPATVGGGVFGNCGAFGFEMSKIVEWVEVWSGGREIRIANSLCGFGYRTSQLPKGCVVTAVCFKLENKRPEEIERVQESFKQKRRESQPFAEKSCGSVYKRTCEAIPAQLIDEAGLKGYRVGGLEVSKKHAGFIVNIGGGTPADFLNITSQIEKVVLKKYRVTLEKEINFVGEVF